MSDRFAGVFAESARDKSESAIALEQAILKSLDGVLSALNLERVADDRFRVVGELGGFTNVFGGQLIAQALMAAGATLEGKALHSMHAYFVRTAAPGPVDLVVERIRDGGSMCTRQVKVMQNEQQLFSLLASYHNNGSSFEIANPPPPAPPPAQWPLFQSWVDKMPPELREAGRIWIEQPLPLEVRIGELPRFMGGAMSSQPRSHWMRLPRAIGDDSQLHTALLAYASDFLVMDLTLRIHPELSSFTGFNGFSLDHALWLHRPVRFDQWHLCTQEALTLSGDRGLMRGTIHDADGHLVASVMQEVLIRPLNPSRSSWQKPSAS